MRGSKWRVSHLWATSLVVSLLSVVPTGCSEDPAAEDVRPNLLLVIVDTLRADRLACYGGEADLGSALCGLGDAGVRYLWAFSAAPYTVPSVASILTSRYPSGHRLSQFGKAPLREQIVTLAEVFSGAGYATAAFVSNPLLNPRRNLDQGFAHYDARMTRRELNRPGFTERVASRTTDAALAWLSSARQPWFLLVHYQDPHGPYMAPEEKAAADQLADPPLPVLVDQSGYRGIPRYQSLPGVRTARAYAARYEAEIRYMDGQLARLLSAADASRHPTGVLLTADHGEALGEDEVYFAHGHSLSLDQIRVPLLWRPPGGAAARVESRPVSNLDVAPTLLRAAGLDIPPSFQGQALPSSIGGGKDRTFYSEHVVRTAVVSGDLYYARDDRPLQPPIRDPDSGGLLRPLPDRVVRLTPEGGVPISGAKDAVGRLQRLIGHFRAGRAVNDRGAERMDAETRQQLRALGYVE